MKKVKYVIFARGEMNKHITGVQLFERGIVSGLNSMDCDEILVKHAQSKLSSRFMRILYEQLWIPLYLNFLGRPFCINLLNTFPILYSKNIITIHDMAPLRGDWYNMSLYRIFYRYILPIHLRISKRVITVSDFSARELSSFFDFAIKKIIVLGNSVSFTERDIESSAVIFPKSIHERKYVLVVGSLDPRKNLDKAITIFKKAGLKDVDLVVIGGSNKIFKSAWTDRTSHNNVFYTGYIAVEELINYYKYCSAFLSMSAYEGFGVPILEALYFSKPVLVNEIPVYREIFDGVVHFVDVNSVELAAKCLSDMVENNNVTYKADELMLKFSWNSLALKLVKGL